MDNLNINSIQMKIWQSIVTEQQFLSGILGPEHKFLTFLTLFTAKLRP